MSALLHLAGQGTMHPKLGALCPDSFYLPQPTVGQAGQIGRGTAGDHSYLPIQLATLLGSEQRRGYLNSLPRPRIRSPPSGIASSSDLESRNTLALSCRALKPSMGTPWRRSSMFAPSERGDGDLKGPLPSSRERPRARFLPRCVLDLAGTPGISGVTMTSSGSTAGGATGSVASLEVCTSSSPHPSVSAGASREGSLGELSPPLPPELPPRGRIGERKCDRRAPSSPPGPPAFAKRRLPDDRPEDKERERPVSPPRPPPPTSASRRPPGGRPEGSPVGGAGATT
ncbi:uncharacterized protein DKFZp434B061-like [Solenopsis invicta]|uniref:uncharacterized protein DKFZp434B061-like n=1 Tax=Solenopsis invicta TaxID=13686 RepID=UPI00193D670F|nr:uncharacterized protein DKFZp434B061-like [Solenopsis invicta]